MSESASCPAHMRSKRHRDRPLTFEGIFEFLFTAIYLHCSSPPVVCNMWCEVLYTTTGQLLNKLLTLYQHKHNTGSGQVEKDHSTLYSIYSTLTNFIVSVVDHKGQCMEACTI